MVPNVRSGSRITPLIYAAKHRSLRVATVLLHYGASTRIESFGIKKAVGFAAENGVISMLGLLYQRGANLKDSGTFDDLSHLAARNGHKGTFRWLGRHGMAGWVN